MESKNALMVGAAVAALTTGPALAEPPAPAIPLAASYAELLEPVPNAVEKLAASDAEAAARPPRLILAQYNDHHHHHHHHHDSAWYRANGYVWNGAAWLLGAQPHHHHHHHDSAWYRANGYFWDGAAWRLRPAPHHHHHHNNY